MKTVIIAKTLLFVIFSLLLACPWVGVAYFAALLHISRKSRRLGRMWLRYYRQTLEWENMFLKKGGMA